MGHLEISEEKHRLREALKVHRRSAYSPDLVRASAEIVQRVAGLQLFRHASIISIFWPRLASNEVNTRPLISKALENNKAVFLPRVTSWDDGMMQHVQYTGELLKPDSMGLFEPQHDPVAGFNPDLAVVPCLAADKKGNRLGYGGGFYDRYLATVPCPIICLAFSQYILDDIPHSDHDQPVDWVATENEIIECRLYSS